MALDTYAGLQSEVVSWAKRTGDTEFEDKAPTFIKLAEDMFNIGYDGVKPLRTREMETTASVSVVNGVGSLPADYLEYLWVKGADGVELEISAESGAEAQYWQQTAGKPRTAVIAGSQIKTYPASTETVTLRYYAKIPALSDTNTTNWLLTKAAAVYLYGSLLHSSIWMEDDEAASRYGQSCEQAMTGLRNANFLSKYARATSKARGYRV